MRPQRRAEPELDTGVAPAQFLPGPRQVPEQVDTSGEKVRNHQDARRTAGRAPASPGGDVGLGQLEEAGLDDRMLAPRRKSRGHRVQVVIGRLVPAAVSDEENCGLKEGLAHKFAARGPSHSGDGGIAVLRC